MVIEFVSFGESRKNATGSTDEGPWLDLSFISHSFYTTKETAPHKWWDRLSSAGPREGVSRSQRVPRTRVMWELYADVKCQGCRHPSIIVTAGASVWTQYRSHILFPILIILESHRRFSLLSLGASQLVSLRTDSSAHVPLITRTVLQVNVNRFHNCFPQTIVANYVMQALPKFTLPNQSHDSL